MLHKGQSMADWKDGLFLLAGTRDLTWTSGACNMPTWRGLESVPPSWFLQAPCRACGSRRRAPGLDLSVGNAMSSPPSCRGFGRTLLQNSGSVTRRLPRTQSLVKRPETLREPRNLLTRGEEAFQSLTPLKNGCRQAVPVCSAALRMSRQDGTWSGRWRRRLLGRPRRPK
jgi:hypothetical protein